MYLSFAGDKIILLYLLSKIYLYLHFQRSDFAGCQYLFR